MIEREFVSEGGEAWGGGGGEIEKKGGWGDICRSMHSEIPNSSRVRI